MRSTHHDPPPNHGRIQARIRTRFRVVVGRLASMGVTFGLIVTVLLGRERPAQDVVSELGRLSAESGAERHDAERWLAVHLQPRDLPDVAQVLKDGTPEAQRRIVHLLGSDDRHLELAAQLSMEGDDDIAGWGAEAVEAMYLRWNPAARDDPLRPGQLPLDWETEPTTPLTFDPGHGSLWEVLDRLCEQGYISDPKSSTGWTATASATRRSSWIRTWIRRSGGPSRANHAAPSFPRWGTSASIGPRPSASCVRRIASTSRSTAFARTASSPRTTCAHGYACTRRARRAGTHPRCSCTGCAAS